MPSLCVSEDLQPKWSQTIHGQYSQNGQRLVGIGYPNASSPCRPHLHDRGASGAQQAAAETTVVPPPEGVEGLTAAFFRMDGMGDLKSVSRQKMLGFKLHQIPRIRNLGFPRFKRH
jgi:hypothetical protein